MNIYNRYSIDYIWSIFVSERFCIYAPRSHTYDIRSRYIRYQLVLYSLAFNRLRAQIDKSMKHKFTVVIESNDDSEDREVVKDCLQDWIEMNCGQEKDLGGYPDWKSAVVE